MYLDDGGVIDPMVELEQIPRDPTIEFFPDGLEPYVEEDIKRWRQDRLLVDGRVSRRIRLAWVTLVTGCISFLWGSLFLFRFSEPARLIVSGSFFIAAAVALRLTRKLAKDRGVLVREVSWAKNLIPEEGAKMIRHLLRISDLQLWIEEIRDDAKSVAYYLLRADHSSGKSFYFGVWQEKPTYMGCVG